MPAQDILSAFRAHLDAQPSRTGSLIITLYGDAIVPRGGSLWLGSLITICQALDIGEGVVRTAVSRLAAEGWLERARVGRNSYYSLAEKGRATFAEATARIYGGAPRAWDGRFRLTVLDEAEAPFVRADRAGTGRLAPGVLVALSAEDAHPGAITLSAEAATQEAGRRLAARLWPLADLARRYRDFLDLLGGPEQEAAVARIGGLDALLLRLLVIHEYRRLVLRDPLLPDALLPAGWPGIAARRCCARLYRALIPASECWLNSNARAVDGPLPPPAPDFAARFATVDAE